MPDPIEDERLIAQVANGERAVFATLVERHGRALLRVARAFASSEAEAEDIAQEAFLAALRGAGTYRPGVSSVRSWLFAIARNAGRQLKRRTREVSAETVDQRPLLELGLAAGWGKGAPEWHLDQTQSAEQLARAIASLPTSDREVLVVRDVEGLDGEATASLLGVPLAAMKSRLHRARLRLMAVLRTQEGGVVESEREVGGLTCSEVLEHLGEYVDGELPNRERAQVDTHLRGCTVCERFGGRYAGTVHAARERLGAAHDVDEATMERVRRALEADLG